MNKGLFSVIVLHYNQPDYVLGALNSVLKQDYERIELIFADDASTSIEIDRIKEFVSENKSDNIENVTYLINEVNQGTVKTINRAVKSANGKHILFFAADDALYDEKVVSNFVAAFEGADDNVYMISSQCHMMDEELKEQIETFVQHTQAIAFNKMTSFEQFRVFCSSCFLAIGATAMRRDMFEHFGYFDERYKFVEDWSCFLRLTRMGGLVKYAFFDGLLHRDGGISHFLSDAMLPAHILQYKLDMMNICENEIFPYYKNFSFREKLNVFHRYKCEKRAYYAGGGKGRTLSEFQLIRLLPLYYIHLFLGPYLNSWVPLLKCVKVSAYISIIFIALAFFKSVFRVGNMLDMLILLAGFAVLISVVVSVLTMLLSVLLKLLRVIKRFFRRW